MNLPKITLSIALHRNTYVMRLEFIKNERLLELLRTYKTLRWSQSGQLFFQNKDVTLLNKSIDDLKKSVSLDPSYAQAYGQLAACYSYFTQKDSAKKYLALADKLDPNVINPEVRKMLTE